MPSSNRNSWWNAWNTPETSFGCSGWSSSTPTACRDASARAFGKRRDGSDALAEHTARDCGARAAPRKGNEAHWPAPSALRHLPPTLAEPSEPSLSRVHLAFSVGTRPVGSSTNSGGNGRPICAEMARDELSRAEGGSAASSCGAAGTLAGAGSVCAGSGAAGAAAAASAGSLAGAAAGAAAGVGGLDARKVYIPQNRSAETRSSSPRSSSLRNSLSSHGARPRPVSAASTAASWGLLRCKGKARGRGVESARETKRAGIRFGRPIASKRARTRSWFRPGS